MEDKKKYFDKDNFSELLFYKVGECKLSREMDCSIIDGKLSNFIWKYSLWFMVVFISG